MTWQTKLRRLIEACGARHEVFRAFLDCHPRLDERQIADAAHSAGIVVDGTRRELYRITDVVI